VQFLLVKMTVSTDIRSSIHLVYTDDVPPEPHHIRCGQHDQQLLSLASRRFCVVLANQRLVAATTNSGHSILHPLARLIGIFPSGLLGRCTLAHAVLNLLD